MQHLKDKQYYEDLYDLGTIESCIRWINLAVKKCNEDKTFEKFSKKEKIRSKNILIELPIYFEKGERYRNREKTINEWMEKDRIKQEKIDNTKEPENIFCNKCNWAMETATKNLHDFTDEPLRVLFFFECPNCHSRKGIFDDGTEYKSKPRVCPECGGGLDISYKKKDDVSIFTEKCKCGYKIEDKTDFKLMDERRKKREELEKQLLIKYRKEFCLTQEEGEKYILSQNQLKDTVDRIKEIEKKEVDPIYQKARSLKKLKVFELQKLLKETLEKERYVELSFEKPELNRDVIIPFSVQESDVNRGDYDSKNNLKKLINKTLEETNWRLMSEGIDQRLGILSGRLRGYESEDDLAKIL